MFVTQLQKAIAYIKQTQEMALFASMADPRWSAAFRASPLYYVMLPFIGFLLTLNAIINGYKLAKASNRNFDLWFVFITSSVCAVLASVSLYGAALSAILGSSFVIGPWFFFSSLMGALAHQLLMFGLNLYRATESPQGSIQRMHYMQALVNNLFVASLLIAVVGSVVFVMLFPVASMIGTVSSITAVVLTGFDILWRILPPNGKKTIKEWIGLGKPDLTQDATACEVGFVKPINSMIHEQEPQQHRLFTRCDYSAVIRKMNVDEAKTYLADLIQRKSKTFVQDIALQDEKTKDKISLLKQLLSLVHAPGKIAKADVLVKYPLAFQSFWLEKGDVEQIFDAVVALQDKYLQTNAPTPVLMMRA
jgi:hypothetical protein